MKKAIKTVFAVAIVTFALTSCGSDKHEETTTTETSTEATTTETSTEAGTTTTTDTTTQSATTDTTQAAH
jgi:hypothetical protein